jgi:hypothetical protein
MKQLISKLKGDKGYGHSALIGLFSVYACFSASSNLAYLGMEREHIGLFSKTFCIYVLFVIIYGSQSAISLF